MSNNISQPNEKENWPEAGQLRVWVSDILDEAARRGVDQAEIDASVSQALSVSVRQRAQESLEHEGDRGVSVTVYKRKASGRASTTDLSPKGLQWALDEALTIARFTEPDPYAGLADADFMASEQPDLGLYNPWGLTLDRAWELALQTEVAALEADPRIAKTEGATVATQDAMSVYANSHGFIGIERASRHMMSCSAIARDPEGGMQRDMAFSQARHADDLWRCEDVGKLAAQRALARLGARCAPTTTAPVLFTPRVARSLWQHLFAAISGGALYRQASFLADSLDREVAAPLLTIRQRPFRRHGLASAGFDGDGVTTRECDLVSAGVLRSFLLSAYSARRLGRATTGNAGGVFNADVTPGKIGFDGLVADMNRGLVVTELMGQGVNPTTGDYSRGAAGWWVENGELAYPVENVTIAGNLAAMYRGVVALGNDVDLGSAIRTPSVVIDAMTIAGS